jgi:hypothetical protein
MKSRFGKREIETSVARYVQGSIAPAAIASTDCKAGKRRARSSETPVIPAMAAIPIMRWPILTTVFIEESRYESMD